MRRSVHVGPNNRPAAGVDALLQEGVDQIVVAECLVDRVASALEHAVDVEIVVVLAEVWRRAIFGHEIDGIGELVTPREIGVTIKHQLHERRA
jgi:hypothetical protein